MRGDCEEGEEEEERGGEEKRTEERDELDNVREEEEEVCKVERLRDYEGEEREEVGYEEFLEMVGNVRGTVLGHVVFGFLGCESCEEGRLNSRSLYSFEGVERIEWVIGVLLKWREWRKRRNKRQKTSLEIKRIFLVSILTTVLQIFS